MLYEVLTPVKFQKRLYKKGEDIDGNALGKETTDHLLKEGAIKLRVQEVPVQSSAPAQPQQPAPAPVADPVVPPAPAAPTQDPPAQPVLPPQEPQLPPLNPTADAIAAELAGEQNTPAAQPQQPPVNPEKA